MNFEDTIFTEELRIKSGEESLDILFRKYMKDVFSPHFLSKIDRVFNVTLKFGDFKQKSNVMCYTQGTKIYINRPMFYSTEKSKAMNYIMHEMLHVLSNTNKFPELNLVNKKLNTIVLNGVERGKESDFFTGKHQNIHSDWHGEVLNYLCNNSINWSVASFGTKLAYKETLEESGLFNMNSVFWKKRFGSDNK